MAIDIREDTARYYDLDPRVPDDIPFYKERLPCEDANILELGCGTGRVLLPLATVCEYIHGTEISEAMLSICRKKLEKAGISSRKAKVEPGDITNFYLRRTFDLIIAPYRVFQNLETDAEVEALFECLQRHRAPDGTCILNVFRPYQNRDDLCKQWCDETEHLEWEVLIHEGRVTCHHKKTWINPDKLILYPEIIYREYRGEELIGKAVQRLVMRCYYPGEFEKLIIDHGFRIIDKWGGYNEEEYGEGPELVIQFAKTG